jgi:hypothetical protein
LPVPVAPVVPVEPALPALLPAGGATAPDGEPGAPVVFAAPPSPFFWQAVRPRPAASKIAKAGFQVLVLFISESPKKVCEWDAPPASLPVCANCFRVWRFSVPRQGVGQDAGTVAEHARVRTEAALHAGRLVEINTKRMQRNILNPSAYTNGFPACGNELVT